jgi:hypothetical protein
MPLQELSKWAEEFIVVSCLSIPIFGTDRVSPCAAIVLELLRSFSTLLLWVELSEDAALILLY